MSQNFDGIFFKKKMAGGGLVALKSLLTLKKGTITSNVLSGTTSKLYVTTHSIRTLFVPGHNSTTFALGI